MSENDCKYALSAFQASHLAFPRAIHSELPYKWKYISKREKRMIRIPKVW